MYLDLLCKLGKSLSRAQDFALVQESVTTTTASGSVEPPFCWSATSSRPVTFTRNVTCFLSPYYGDKYTPTPLFIFLNYKWQN